MGSTPHHRSLTRLPVGNFLSSRVSPWIAGGTLAAAYLVMWFIRRTYTGLDDDAHLYAFQAIARLKPYLGVHDLFLAYGSQDQYTLFTPCYAWLISRIGLGLAEAGLTVLFHAWSAIAAWFLVRRFATYELSWLAVGIVIMMPGAYGSHGVFEYSESFLTARLPAEAFVLSAIALYLAGRRILCVAAATLALLTHPIVAAPGLIVLVLLAAGTRQRIWLISAAIAGAILLFSTIALHLLPVPIVDDAWLNVLRDRSSFMFMNTWRPADWDWALLTLIGLIYAARASTMHQGRDLFALAALVGSSGLLLTAASNLIPIQLLMQAQPWRWMWLATFVAVLSLVPTIVKCRHESAVAGYSCLMLCTAWVFPVTWAFPGVISAPIAFAALLLLWMQDRIPERYVTYVRWLCVGMVLLALSSVVASVVQFLRLDFTTNRESIVVQRARDIFALSTPAILVVYAVWALTVRRRLAVPTLIFGCGIAAIAVDAGPRTHAGWARTPYDAAYANFAPWRALVDHQRNVLWADDPVAVWLLLDSPSYLSTSQTAGVVFSRQTAMEAKRRAAALTPLAGYSEFGLRRPEHHSANQPTVEILKQICRDPLLGYVVTSQKLDLPHLGAPAGRWASVNLYACDDALSNEL